MPTGDQGFGSRSTLTLLSGRKQSYTGGQRHPTVFVSILHAGEANHQNPGIKYKTHSGFFPHAKRIFSSYSLDFSEK
jgi:hypothetical protein